MTPSFASASFVSTAIKLRALLLVLLLGLMSAAVAAPPPVAGVDYVVIADGQPYAPLRGKTEVIEVFGYWCRHCAEFQPTLAAWKRKLPADVRFTYVPAVFTAGDAFARAYFAAEHFGALPAIHDAMFSAIHSQGLLPQNASVDEIAAYLGQQDGLDVANTKAYMTSPQVDVRLQQARDFALHSGIQGTPTLVINGRYRVLGDSHADALRIASALIAKERAAR